MKIPLREIVYIEAMDNYVRIHLCGARPALSQMSLKSLAELLPATFVRIHKSFIVPLHRIAAYTRTSLYALRLRYDAADGTGVLSRLY